MASHGLPCQSSSPRPGDRERIYRARGQRAGMSWPARSSSVLWKWAPRCPRSGFAPLMPPRPSRHTPGSPGPRKRRPAPRTASPRFTSTKRGYNSRAQLKTQALVLNCRGIPSRRPTLNLFSYLQSQVTDIMSNERQPMSPGAQDAAPSPIAPSDHPQPSPSAASLSSSPPASSAAAPTHAHPTPSSAAGGGQPRADSSPDIVKLGMGRAHFFLNSGDAAVDCWRAKVFGFQTAVFDFIHFPPEGGDC